MASLKKNLSTMIFAILLVALSLSVSISHAQDDGYTFLAMSSEVVGYSRDAKEINARYYLVEVARGIQAPLLYLNNIDRHFILSPDGQKAVLEKEWFSQKGEILNILDGEVQTYPFRYIVSPPYIWSPNSKYFTAAVYPSCGCDTPTRNVNVGIVDTETGDLRVLTEGEFFFGDSDALAWSSDGSQLAYIDKRYDASTRQERATIKVISIDSSHEPRTLFTYVADLNIGGSGLIFPILRWLPDGKHIALTTRASDTSSYNLRLFEVQTGQLSFHYASNQYFDACWSPTTDHFVIATQTEFTLMTPNSAPHLDTDFIDPSSWQIEPAFDVPCIWSPDGEKLALVDTHHFTAPLGIKLINFSAQTVRDIEIEGNDLLMIPFWSPDSRLLALKSSDLAWRVKNLHIFDTTTMEQVMSRLDLSFIAWISTPIN